MVLIFHIVIALSSIAYTTYLFFRPSLRGLHIVYGLIGTTLASGTYLVLSTHSNILHSCISGLVYIGLVLTGIVLTQRKLAHATSTHKDQ